MYKLNFGKMAKDIISSATFNNFNKEILDSWIEVAVSNNVNELYNTPDINLN